MRTFLSLALLLAATAHANTSAGWLRTHAETVAMLDQINVAHVAGLKDCACAEQVKANQRSHAACAGQAPGDPGFIRQIMNMYGERRNREITCTQILESLVFGRLEFDWPELRRSMALMYPAEHRVDGSGPAASESFVGDINLDLKIRRNPRHEIRNVVGSIPVQTPAPLTTAEVTEYMVEYRAFGMGKCQQVLAAKRRANFPGSTPGARRDYQGLNDLQICQLLINGVIPGRPTAAGAVWGVRADLEDVLPAIARVRNTEYRQQHQADYAALLQANPLLALVSRPRPSWNELIRALDYIEGNARSRLTRTQRDLREGNHLRFVGRYHAIPYSRARWEAKEYSVAQFDAFLESNHAAFQRMENGRHQIELIATIGVTVACVLPWGRALSTAMQVLKMGCLAGLGIPFNAFYLLDSFNRYQGAFRNLFSSIEHQQAFFEDGVSKVASVQEEAAMSALFLPVGMGLADIAQFRSALGRLGRSVAD